MKINKCIYCNQEGTFSEEHPFPDGFGEFQGFPIIDDRICRGCNSKIGAIEEQLLRSGPEAFLRKYLGIKGKKKHEKVNIFQRSNSGAPPIDIKASLPDNETKVLIEIDDNGFSREVRQFILKYKDGSQKHLRIHDYMLASEECFYSGIMKSGIDISKVKDIEIICTDEEGEIITEYLKKTHKLESLNKPTDGEGRFEAHISFTVTDKYIRALAKIGFHTLLAINKNYYGNEDFFKHLKLFIMEGKGKVDFEEINQPIIPFPQNMTFRNWSHIIAIVIDETYIKAQLQLFIGPSSIPPVYQIMLLKDNDLHLKPFHKIFLLKYKNEGAVWKPEKAIEINTMATTK